MSIKQHIQPILEHPLAHRLPDLVFTGAKNRQEVYGGWCPRVNMTLESIEFRSWFHKERTFFMWHTHEGQISHHSLGFSYSSEVSANPTMVSTYPTMDSRSPTMNQEDPLVTQTVQRWLQAEIFVKEVPAADGSGPQLITYLQYSGPVVLTRDGDRTVEQPLNLANLQKDPKVAFHGTISQLKDTCDATFQNFGDYNLVSNNCQHFVDKLAVALGGDARFSQVQHVHKDIWDSQTQLPVNLLTSNVHTHDTVMQPIHMQTHMQTHMPSQMETTNGTNGFAPPSQSLYAGQNATKQGFASSLLSTIVDTTGIDGFEVVTSSPPRHIRLNAEPTEIGRNQLKELLGEDAQHVSPRHISAWLDGDRITFKNLDESATLVEMNQTRFGFGEMGVLRSGGLLQFMVKETRYGFTKGNRVILELAPTKVIEERLLEPRQQKDERREDDVCARPGHWLSKVEKIQKGVCKDPQCLIQ